MNATQAIGIRSPRRDGELALVLLRSGLAACALALTGSLGAVLWRIAGQ